MFGSLLLIFIFSFNFLKKSFFEAVNVEISSSKNFYHNEYKGVHTHIDKTINHLELIFVLPGILSMLISAFRTAISAYSCPRLPRNTNYVFLYLEKHYKFARAGLDKCLDTDLSNAAERARLADALARKTL